MLFVDESGTPPNPGAPIPRYFVVGGVIIPESAWTPVKDRLLGLKARRGIRGEFKWRYFAPGNAEQRNPMRHLCQSARDEIRKELYQIICRTKGIKSIAAICSAAAAYQMPSISDQSGIYHLTYKTVTERFQYYLQDVTDAPCARGIVIADHRGKDDDKGLRAHHQMLLHSSAEFVSTYKNLVESLFLQRSELSIGIQLADLIAGAVWRKFERNDAVWYGHMETSLRRGPNGDPSGYGIIRVPKRNWA